MGWVAVRGREGGEEHQSIKSDIWKIDTLFLIYRTECKVGPSGCVGEQVNVGTAAC